MKIKLAKLRYHKHLVIAKLQGGKCIIRVDKPRSSQWFLVLPVTGYDEDHTCILIDTIKKRAGWGLIGHKDHQDAILKQYADRIINKIEA